MTHAWGRYPFSALWSVLDHAQGAARLQRRMDLLQVRLHAPSAAMPVVHFSEHQGQIDLAFVAQDHVLGIDNDHLDPTGQLLGLVQVVAKAPTVKRAGRGLRALWIEGRDHQLASAPQYRRQDFRVPAVAAADFHRRHVLAQSQERQRLQWAAVRVALGVAGLAVRAGERSFDGCARIRELLFANRLDRSAKLVVEARALGFSVDLELSELLPGRIVDLPLLELFRAGRRGLGCRCRRGRGRGRLGGRY